MAAVLSIIFSWMLFIGQNYHTALYISPILGGWIPLTLVLMGVVFEVI